MLLASVGGALPEALLTDRLNSFTARARQMGPGAEGQTGYQGHRLVAAALDELSTASVDTIVDAGCGTGLVGELFAPKPVDSSASTCGTDAGPGTAEECL